MAAITPTKRSAPISGGATIVEFYGTSATNQADTFTTPVVPSGGAYRLTRVTVAYDGDATYTGTALTVMTDSGVDPIYDTLLQVGTDNADDFVYFPTGDCWLLPGDAIVVAVPAGGASREASVVVSFEAR